MTEHSLSENMEEWPVNPYALFGVEPGVSERDLRKAYHRLIKQFRPEHAPEQFRKLNEAYESLRVQVHYEQHYPQQEDETEAENPDDDSDWISGTNSRPAEQAADTVSAVETQRTEAWQLAVEGELATAAERLESLLDANLEDEESLLRLYWVKRLADAKPPLSRMETFLKCRGSSCRMFPIYLLETETNRSVALRSSARELLLTMIVEHQNTQLAQSAWLQLVRQKQFSRIGEDLDSLKPELVYDHPMLWALTVFQAAEILALSNTSKQHPLMQRLWDEIRDCEPTLENEWAETRWNLVRSLVFDSARDVNVPERLVALIKDSMLGEPWEHRYRLERIAEPWVNSPSAGLSVLKRLRRYSSSAVYLLHRFAEQLLEDRYRYHDDKYYEFLTPRIIEFGDTQAPDSYEILSEKLAHFCRTEDIELELFINEVLELEKQGRLKFLSDEVISVLNDDWPLRCLISCTRLFNE